jgi:chitodextrinase
MRALIAILVAILTLGLTTAAAPPNRAPSRPTSLHITSTTPYSVSLSWNASSDQDSFSYVIQASNGYFMTAPQTATSATFDTYLFPRNTYTFNVYAVDAAGNRSNSSNSVRTTLGADTTVPAAPTVTITDIGPTHASLAWSTTDNDPIPSFFISINGVQVGHSTRNLSGTFNMLRPETTYTISVQARDSGLNLSPTTTLTFTTEPIDTSDTTPPTAPTDFFAYTNGDLELFLYWTQSTDNVDPREAIRYEIYVNGVLSENVIGVGETITYGEAGSNTLTIIAIDTAGNESAPTTIHIDI